MTTRERRRRVPRNTNVSTESLVPLSTHPNNQSWILARMTFLLSMQSECPDYFYGQWGKTVSETMDNYLKSLSHELAVLRETYPKIYLYATREELSEWLKEGISDNISIIV